MPLTVIFVSGPRRCGKSTLIHLMVSSQKNVRPHYLRLVDERGTDPPHLTVSSEAADGLFLSVRRLDYETEHIFEVLPEALVAIRKKERYGLVVIEADADPALRHAYPYDHRLFVMPAPDDVHQVFRTPEQAASALQEVMNDTACFAREIFGLFDDALLDDDDSTSFQKVRQADRIAEEHLEVTAAQMKGFVTSPIGAEIASRIQLQPEYHGLVESDVVAVNMAVGSRSGVADQVINRLNILLDRIHQKGNRKNILFNCDFTDPKDCLQPKLLKKLADMIKTKE